MSTASVHTLTQRLDGLERENRWWKIVGSIAVGVLALFLFIGATDTKVADEVRAERFVLFERATGKTTAELGNDAVFGPQLTFFDVIGEQRGQLRRDRLVFNGEKHDRKLELYFRRSQGGLNITTGEQSAMLLSGDSAAMLLLSAGSKVEEGFARLAAGGHDATLTLTGRPSEIILRGSPSVRLHDKEQTRAVLGHIELVRPATDVVEQRPGSSLVLFDKDGKVIWKAP